MRQIVMIVIWSLALQVVACGQEQTKQSIIKIKDVRDSQDSGLAKIKIPPFDSVRFRFIPEKEKWRLSVKSKIRNGNILRRSGVFPTVSYNKNSDDTIIREDVEGIVTYRYRGVRREKNNGFYKAEFYHNEDSIPFKIIYVDDSIPFKKQEYKNLKDEIQQIEGDQLMQRQPDISKVDR
ncbi:MAG: hypothetical protein ACOYOA_10885 [Saprospiraceae bacterium]